MYVSESEPEHRHEHTAHTHTHTHPYLHFLSCTKNVRNRTTIDVFSRRRAAAQSQEELKRERWIHGSRVNALPPQMWVRGIFLFRRHEIVSQRVTAETQEEAVINTY